MILDRPINNWLRANFSPAELADSSVSGDAADPAGDRLPNLLKYALGFAAKTPAADPFIPAETDGLFTVTFPRSTTAPDVSLLFDWSTNLVNWQPGSDLFQTLNVTDQVTNQIVTIDANAAAPSGFVRVKAARQ